MGRIDRTVLWAIVAIGFFALSAAALYYANDWWLSGVMTVSIVAWLVGVLAIFYGRPERRPAVVGAVLASFLYVLFAVGPWFRVHVGPWLLTSQALVQIETKWLGRQPQAQQVTYTAVPSATWGWNTGGNPTVFTPQVLSGSTLAVVTGATAPQYPSFVILGHWLCGWPAATLGALVVAWMTRRSKSKSAVGSSTAGSSSAGSETKS